MMSEYDVTSMIHTSRDNRLLRITLVCNTPEKNSVGKRLKLFSRHSFCEQNFRNIFLPHA